MSNKGSIIIGFILLVLVGISTFLIFEIKTLERPELIPQIDIIQYRVEQALTSLDLPEYKIKTYSPVIAYACKKYNVSWKDAVAMYCVESWFDTYAVGDSLVGFTKERARGIQQNIPSTAKESAANLGFPYIKGVTEHNPIFGMISGIYTLANNYITWGNQEHAIKAYIMGTQGLRKYYAGDKRMKKLYKLAMVDESWERFCKFYNSIEDK